MDTEWFKACVEAMKCEANKRVCRKDGITVAEFYRGKAMDFVNTNRVRLSEIDDELLVDFVNNIPAELPIAKEVSFILFERQHGV